MENSTTTNEKTPSSTPSIDERDLVMSMRKLDLIKELGDKQNQFQRLQTHLQQNNDVITRESQAAREFRKELDILVQERMSHIEELRLIHADINIMETTIKQSEEERVRAIQESKRLLKDYQPIKEEINKIRDMLSLDRLTDHDDDETGLATVQLLTQQQQQQTNEHEIPTNRISTALDNTHETFSLGLPFHHHQTSQLANTTSTTNPTSTANQQQQQTPTGLNLPKVIGGLATNVDRSTFRQQPPPMKTCQSCQQQIHRNAPICPICKAKSRSRNPKKPKRRHTDIHP